jgi:thermitase
LKIRYLLRTSYTFIVIMAVAVTFVWVQKVEAKEPRKHVHNEVLVRFQEDVEDDTKKSIREALGATLIKTIESIRVEHWNLPEVLTVEEALVFLNNTPEVEYAEPNIFYKPLSAPNDPDFDKLWFLENRGQIVNGKIGTPGADISAAKAWDLETGSHGIVIAVIDSGVAYDHPDLNNNVWVNTDEVANNGIDDDNNGYIDDVYGWDFVNNDNNPSDYSSDLYGDGHGTHVAGTIAAQGNNDIGVCGVMWRAQIMPLQIFDLFQINTFDNKIIQLVNIILALEYAVDNNAKIINCSFGGPLSSQFVYDAISLANQKGVLVIVAAGNDGSNNDLYPNYPASYDLPNIITVAATNESDELSSYSNYGQQTVDIAAPGGSITNNQPNIYSTTPPERVVLFYDNFEDGGAKWLTSGIYEPWSIGYDPVFGSNTAQDSVDNYYNNESSTMRTANPIKTNNCKGLHFKFLIDYALEDGYDFLYIEGSNDGLNYDTAYYATGFSNGIVSVFDWGNEIELGDIYLRFRLESDYVYNYDGVYIDDILLTGVPWKFDGDEYGFKSGTSMAAPVVSGVAGLIWSYRPNLSHIEVKNAILNSVDKLDVFNGIVLSGGRVNAYRALTMVKSQPLKSMPWIPLLLLDEE